MILTYFGSLVCFSTVLWVIVVEVSLSDCLSGQLHSHLVHYFINSYVSSIESALSDWHCLIGNLSNLIYICSYFICLCSSDFWVSLGTKLNCQRNPSIYSNHNFLLWFNHNFFDISVVTIIFCCFHGYHVNLLPLATVDCFYGYKFQEIYKIYKIYLSICFIQMVTSVSLVTGNFYI